MKAQPQPGIYTDGMTAPERAFADRCQIQKLAGELADWAYEPVVLHTAAGNYTPDFMLTEPSGEVYMVEVKARSGNWRSGSRDSVTRFKAARDRFWQFRFIWYDYQKGSFEVQGIK